MQFLNAVKPNPLPKHTHLTTYVWDISDEFVFILILCYTSARRKLRNTDFYVKCGYLATGS